LDTQQQMFNKQRTQHHNIVKASFVVSETKIAKHSKSFGEGEFFKECLVDVASIICPEKKKKLREYLFVETYCCPTDINDG
jgi:hypothetical protein